MPFFFLEGAEEIQQVLLLLGVEVLEVVDYGVGFGALAGVLVNGVDEIGGAAIVEEEDALAESPEGRGAEFVGCGGALGDAVGEIRAHVMDEQIGEEVGGAGPQAWIERGGRGG